jgi:hypothetical protein
MDKEDDVRLTTRHFDLLMAAAIAYQMRNYAEVARVDDEKQSNQGEYERPGF